MMKKIVAGASALAITASAALIPTRASAYDDWDRPAVGVNVGALSIGVGTDDDDDYDYGGPRAAAFIPAENGYCHIGREIGPDGYWHRVQVCE
jgi:hypothetical protein